MINLFARFWREVCTAEHRPAFRPRIAVFNVWFRIVGYGTALVGAPFVIADTARLTVTLAVLTLPIGFALYDLRSQILRPAPPMLIDLIVAPIVVTAGLGAPAVGLAVAGIVAVLIHVSMTFRMWTLTVGSFSAVAITALVDAALTDPDDVQHPIGVWLVVVALIGVSASLVIFQWQQTRRALRLSETELSTVIASTPIMLIRISPDWTMTSVSGPVATSWTVGDDCRSLLPAPLLHMIDRGFHREPSTGDVTIDGRMFEVTCQPFDGGTLVTGFDVTERQQTRAELETLLRTKDEFVASISHELRTPLTAVLGFATELQRMDVLDREAALFVDTIVEQSSDMAAIIDDLLVAVRADLDIFTVAQRPVDLAAETLRVLKATAPRTDKPISTTLDDTTAVADGERVRQVIRNLIVNADRYGGQHMAVTVSSHDGTGTICVADDGPPIPAAHRARMFDPFESTGRTTGRTAALGLGLSVSKRLAELMHGSLGYDHVDGWSTFTLTLPLAAPIVQTA